MKYWLSLLIFFYSIYTFTQNVQVDSQTYTPQQLIENILINNNCLTNVVVTNAIGGNFGSSDQSYGFFDASGTSFPFQSGVVLSTGRLSNVGGPNNSLSDDDAANWGGDNDLENVLNETNTLNATIIEFEFVPLTSLIRFRYLFASEEYQIGDPNTCRFSDLFGFLIREVSDTQYTNIALVPGTQTPVKVTTVHPDITAGCTAQNETYFGSFNDVTAPINFNGQTTVLSAVANVIPGQTYHVKLVIADEENYRYDSAVFLEAGGLQLGTDLGPNRLIENNNALCENDTLELNAFQAGNNTYKWFKDGVELLGEINATYTVLSAGTYEVEVLLESGCTSYGDIIIEYSQNPIVLNSTITQCDNDQDGLSIYNLFDAEESITNSDNTLLISDFFLTFQDAEQNIDPINTSLSFENTTPQQIVYARVENQLRCFSIAEVLLDTSNNTVTINPFEACDDEINDGVVVFNLNDLIAHIQPFTPVGSSVNLFWNETDALQGTNPISGTFTNVNAYSETLFVKIENNTSCYAISALNLVVKYQPILSPDTSIFYCLNTFPETIEIDASVLNDTSTNYTYQWLLNNLPLADNNYSININEVGEFTVIATHLNGCEASRTIMVNPANTATINNIIIEEASSNNTVTILVSNESDYEFSLDTQIFSDNTIFTNVKPGFHTVYVRDKNGCGVIEEQISVLGFPKFFTPNSDGTHETWKPLGVNGQFNSNIEIKIFDRYGKLLKQLDPLGSGWDGTFNGLLMPTDDYWFRVLLDDGRTFMGHFTLKR